MTGEFKESKIGGNLFFIGVKPANERVSVGPYPSIFHLFEHQYDAETVFWYGVADAVFTIDEFHAAAIRAGVPAPPFGGQKNPQNFGLRVELDDGRRGLAQYWSGRHEWSLQDQSAKVAFVCGSALTLKP